MVENQTEIVTTWSEHPTVIVTGTVIKTIQAPFTIDDLKKEATLLQKCQAFTSLGHLLTDITNVDDWMYDKNTVSYLKKQTKLTKEVKEVKQTKLTKEVKEVKEEKATKTGSNVIPKIMHMLYNTENFALMPSNVRNMIVYNVENLNDWDYRLYTPDKTLSFVDKEYPELKEVYPELKEVYTMLHPKQKYELMKISKMYTHTKTKTTYTYIFFKVYIYIHVCVYVCVRTRIWQDPLGNSDRDLAGFPREFG